MKKIIFTIGMAIMVGTTIQAQNQPDSPSATLRKPIPTTSPMYQLQVHTSTPISPWWTAPLILPNTFPLNLQP